MLYKDFNAIQLYGTISCQEKNGSIDILTCLVLPSALNRNYGPQVNYLSPSVGLDK